MLNYIYESLYGFRKVFSRHRSWLIFAMLVLGFMGVSEITGVSSFCRFWLLNERGYYPLLGFFRSNAWSLHQLIDHWSYFVLAQQESIFIQGRLVFLGDHTSVSQEGRRMPGVVSIHQDSETQSKSSYFRGQYWGAIGVLVGTLASPFCLPLMLKIHQGFAQIGEEPKAREDRSTLGERVVRMALDLALKNDVPSVLILDAFFSVASVFKLADSVYSTAIKAPMVTIIVRAKKNYVAYLPAKVPKKKKRGRPKKYGKKVVLIDVFEHQKRFAKVTCQIYHRSETILINYIDLLWKPTGSMIRFVFAITSRGPIILMCSDLDQNPILALELYCSRVRIEVMFDVLKNVLFAFNFRFWSKKMPRNSRKPKKNKNLHLPEAQDLPTVKRCWEAYECFVMIGVIAQGLLQLLSLKFTQQIWRKHHFFVRTFSRELPSEKTVKQVITPIVIFNLMALPSNGIMREIQERFPALKNTLRKQTDEQNSEEQAA